MRTVNSTTPLSAPPAYPIGNPGTPGTPWGAAERAAWLARQRVQRHNRASLSAMTALGFNLMPVAAQPPGDDLHFLRLGDAAGAADPSALAAPATLCARQAPDLRLAQPAAAAATTIA